MHVALTRIIKRRHTLNYTTFWKQKFKCTGPKLKLGLASLSSGLILLVTSHPLPHAAGGAEQMFLVPLVTLAQREHEQTTVHEGLPQLTFDVDQSLRAS